MRTLGTRIAAFHDWLALKICAAVGTMWCAYLFVCIAIVGFPRVSMMAVNSLPELFVWLQKDFTPWLSQTLIQLVMLAILQIGANIAMELSDRRQAKTHALIVATHNTAVAEIRELKGMHEDLHTLLRLQAEEEEKEDAPTA